VNEDAAAMEYLAVAGPPRRWWTIAIVIGTAVIAALSLLAWDAIVRRNADSAFASAVAQAQYRTNSGEAAVEATLAYASPMIWSAAVPEGVKSDLRALVEASAARSASQLDRIRQDAVSTTVLPWQADQQGTRERLLALIDEQRARFERIAGDARTIGEVLASSAPSVAGVLG
jgi:hypothetical protein